MHRPCWKNCIIFKNHIFPGIQKPLRSLADIIMIKNPELNIQKARKMAKILDVDETRRMKTQRNQFNDIVNLEIQEYIKRYIKPMQGCPDYYEMLFLYVRAKAEIFYESQIQISNVGSEPFHVNKIEFSQIKKRFKNELSVHMVRKNQKIYEKQSQSEVEKVPTEIQKLTYLVMESLYPSEKVYLLKKFEQSYKNFLTANPLIVQEIFQQQITAIKPFLLYSPAQLFQSHNIQLKIHECEELLDRDKNLREKYLKEFIQLLEQRKNQLEMLSNRYQISEGEILSNIKRQYIETKKYQGFYSIIMTQ